MVLARVCRFFEAKQSMELIRRRERVVWLAQVRWLGSQAELTRRDVGAN